MHYGACCKGYVALVVLVGYAVKAVPRAEVCPAERAAAYIYVLAPFEYNLVDRKIQVRGVVLVHEVLFFLAREVYELVYVWDDVGYKLCNRVLHGLGVPQVKSGVPQELPAFYENARKVLIWLFGERLYRRQSVLVGLVCHLDITVFGGRHRGAHSHGHKHVVVCHEIERVANVALENVAAQDVLVGRRHYNPCVGLLIYYVAVCPGNGGRGSEPYGFGQDVAARKVGKLALHDVDIVYKRRNINMIRLDETRKTFVCELK